MVAMLWEKDDKSSREDTVLYIADTIGPAFQSPQSLTMMWEIPHGGEKPHLSMFLFNLAIHNILNVLILSIGLAQVRTHLWQHISGWFT